MGMKKSTQDLMLSLKNSDDIGSYIKKNESQMVTEPLHFFLQEMLKKKKMTKSQVIKEADFNDIYGYQIFSGFRLPSRDKLICLCIGMHCTVEETNMLLANGGFASLYPKSKRDSVIIWALEKKCTISETNGLLFDYTEKTLN